MQGLDVLHPIGWDAFGLPAEQHAIKTGTHPEETTNNNIANMRRQTKALGFSYDWEREIATTDPEYYRWTQWIFLKLFGCYFDETQQKARPIEEPSIPEGLSDDHSETDTLTVRLKTGDGKEMGVCHCGVELVDEQRLDGGVQQREVLGGELLGGAHPARDQPWAAGSDGLHQGGRHRSAHGGDGSRVVADSRPRHIPVFGTDEVADVTGAVVRRCAVEYGVPPHDLEAYLGPAISGSRYEVGWEVIDSLRALEIDERRWRRERRVDLRDFLSARLEDLGLDPAAIRTVDSCTASTPELASHRRDGAIAGRQWSMIYRID